MKWQRNEPLEEELLDTMLERVNAGYVKQSPSITDLIYCLTKTYYDATCRIPPTRKTKLYFTIGLGLEAALVKDKSIATTGEHDGIYYHIDSMDYDHLLELKSTRISSKKQPNEFSQSWLKQIKGYLKTQNRTRASLAVLHIGSPPEIILWDLEFEQGEIDINWQWLLSRKAVWDQAVLENEPPESYRYNEDWECRDCVYATLCEARKAMHLQR